MKDGRTVRNKSLGGSSDGGTAGSYRCREGPKEDSRVPGRGEEGPRGPGIGKVRAVSMGGTSGMLLLSV